MPGTGRQLTSEMPEDKATDWQRTFESRTGQMNLGWDQRRTYQVSKHPVMLVCRITRHTPGDTCVDKQTEKVKNQQHPHRR
jgi:hypothetical protein